MPVRRPVISEFQARQRKFTILIVGFKYMVLYAIAECYCVIGIGCNKFVGAVNVEDKYRSLYGPILRIITK
jgi:hypothetical protein